MPSTSIPQTEGRVERAGPSWTIAERGGLHVAQCLPLLELPGISHAFSTRRAEGDDPFDLGAAERTDPEVEQRRRRLCEAAGLAGRRPTLLRQVHGCRVIGVREAAGATPSADGVVAAASDPADPVPAVRTADCVPILLADRAGAALAAVHGGWRGAAAGIALEAVRALGRAGAAPGTLVAALGPAIGRCCYQVGAEVCRAVARASGVSEGAISTPASRGARLLDLHEAHRRQLERAGIPAASIYRAPWCTACRPDLFFSHRREGPAAGRQMACLGRTPLP